MNRRRIFVAFLLVFLTGLYPACQKPERNNLWDEKNAQNPQEWSPQNLQISTLSPVIRKLSWDYGAHHIEGFKIDRKKGDESWQEAYATLPKTAREWIDDLVVPGPALLYQYRVYAFAGINISVKPAITASAAIPAPDNIQITTHSTTSITLSWNYSITGHDGFIIDRKQGNEPWVTGFATLGPGQTSFQDNTLYLASQDYTYRVYVYYQAYQSQKIEAIPSPKIGWIKYGGIVFYLDGNGGGLVCAESNQSTGAEWGCYGTTISGTGTSIGTGAANTAKIVAGCSQAGTAARICNDLVLNGYSDWFLPSKDELNLMYQNLKQAGLGGFAGDWFWSSSEYSSNTAWSQFFYNGGQNATNKIATIRVRAVRAF